MHTQRLTFTRVETITVEVTYPVDPTTKANAEFWANRGWCNASPLGRPGCEPIVGQAITEWKLQKAEPTCLLAKTPEVKKGKK